MSNVYDAVIVGLGAMGSAAAWHLARRGARVVGLEQFTPAHDLGSSHGESRIIRQAYFEHPDYVPLVLSCYDQWREIEKKSAIELLLLSGGLMLSPPRNPVFRGSLLSARRHRLSHEVWDLDKLRTRYPAFQPPSHFASLYEPRAGVLLVEKCILAMQRLATRAGANLHFEERVLGWEAGRGNAPARVRTNLGEYSCRALILAAGAWSPSLLRSLGANLTVERLVMHWFQPEGALEAYEPQRFPVHIWGLDNGSYFYGMPAIPNGIPGLKLAFHEPRERCTPATIEREVREEEIQAISESVRTYLPDLAHRHIAAKTCMYTTTPDEHFVLGPHPDQSGVFLACGFSGHGFKFAPVMGEALADLALEGKTNHPIGLFDPTRFRANQTGPEPSSG